MKIDASAIAVLLFFVAPGYMAYWIRNHFVPRTLVLRGATEELAGFVVVSAFIHCILGLIITLVLLIHGAISQCDPTSDFTAINHTGLGAWWDLHPTNGLIAVIIYFLLSCATGMGLGFLLAMSTLSWKTTLWRMVRSELNDDGAWLRQHGIRGLIAEQPAIYTALRPDLGNDGKEKLVMIEAELRDGKGFYIGQVASYSISKDEDPHKLILLYQAQFSKDRISEYGPVETGSLLIDLADVLILRITQVARTPSPTLEP